MVVPAVLLAAMLAGRQLNSWAFSPDESVTMITAGARDYGPLTPAEALQTENTWAPDQAFGWVLVLNRWGALAGWSPVAMRAGAWLAGLLSLALVYRAGRSLLSHEAGAIAALLLASSTLFVSWMHVGRVYTLVTVFSSLALWGYWRLGVDTRRAGRRHWAGLLLGGVGLLYTHYLAALILAAVGLFHLAFARKDRRWWRVLLLLALMALSALPQLTALLRAADIYAASGEPVVTAASMAVRILHALGNGLVSLPQAAGPALLLLMLVALLMLLRRQARGDYHAGRYLGIVILVHIFLIFAINEVIGVMWYQDRVRYFLVLWPPLALLAGHGICRLWRSKARLAEWLLVAFVAVGVALILRSGVYFSYATYNQSFIHLADQALQREARPDDLLLLDEGIDLNMFYEGVFFTPRLTFTTDSEPQSLQQQVDRRERVWLLARDARNVVEERLAGELHFCRRPVNRGSLALTLYARSEAECG